MATPLAHALETRIALLESEVATLRALSDRRGAALQELRHRAKNSLQTIVSLLRLQTGRLTEPTARALANQSLRRIEAIAIAYRHLGEPGVDEQQIHLAPYLTDLAQALAAQSADDGTAVGFTVDVDATLWTSLGKLVPLGLIAHELMTTMMHNRANATDVIRLAMFPGSDGIADLTLTRCTGPAWAPAAASDSEPEPALIEALAGQLGGTITTTVGARETAVVFAVRL
ncbi:MAG: sensor histidine kinase [Azospirillaceae bacterium]|nr:sensor histidine kinase [Azospirillaceae bacterium]